MHGRASIARLRQHPWVSQGYKFVDGLAQRSPPLHPRGTSVEELFNKSIDPVMVVST